MLPGETTLHLDLPPTVGAVGVGVHGGRRRQERWLLPELHALHLYRYEGDVLVGGQLVHIRPGSVSIVAPGILMDYRFGGLSEHLYAHFSLARTGPAQKFPTFQDMGIDGSSLFQRLQATLSMESPAQRSSELWSILWRVARLGASPRDGGPNPSVVEAVRFIDENLGQRLNVATIAASAQFSVTHLDRLFRSATGMTVSKFVMSRRMELARDLLRETSQSIPLVASSVGIADLQAFNKACRRWWGASPRQIRRAEDAAT